MTRRSVVDIHHYDPPAEIYKAITSEAYPYTERTQQLQARDKALMAVIYATAARVSEVIPGKTRVGQTPGLQAQDIIFDQDFIRIRNLRQIKVKTFERSGVTIPITDPLEYPVRFEIPLPRNQGSLAPFTELIESYLDTQDTGPLFPVTRQYAHRIINRDSGLWCHYLRDQGIRYWYRVFKGDPFRLKRFTGHRQWASLEKYMQEFTQADLDRLREF